MSKDHAKIWRSGPLGDTVFLRANYHEQRFDRHFHDEYAIGIIDSGCQAFAYDNVQRLNLTQGSIALISPGVVHAGWPGVDEGWRYRMFYPAMDVVRQANDDLAGPLPSFHRPAVTDNALAEGISRLHALSADPEADTLELQSLFLMVMRRALQSHAGQGGGATSRYADALSVSLMRDFLEAEYQGSVSLDALARTAGLSRFQALRHFKRTFGLTPHAYLRQVRLRHARNLIYKHQDLADVAAAAGFSDQAHMTRIFRQSLGYTPGALAGASAAIAFKTVSN